MTEPDRPEASVRPESQPAVFFEYGFRPFFLAAGLQAVLAMTGWLAWIGLTAASPGPVETTLRIPVHVWHAHEMIFGYGLAAVAGFLLTAVPNWTGRRPVSGAMLAGLFGLWVTARLASWLSAFLPPLLVAIPEIGFIAMLAGLVGQALLSGWSKRNLVFLPVLAAFLVAASLHHFAAAGRFGADFQTGHLLGLNLLLVLITVLGGRIVPAFTTNALRRQGGLQLPRPSDRRDVATILAVVVLTLVDLVAPGSAVSGWVAIAAAAAVAVRMLGWQTGRVLGSPILWILHLAFVWLVAGFLLKGVALLTGSFSEVTALHALSIGAIGSMTLGVMSRAALGHTGRELRVSRPIVGAYMLISGAAAMRVAGPIFVPTLYDAAMLVSGALWTIAFVIFVVIYWPVLTRPRISARPQ